MKKPNLKSILGTAIVITALANAQAEIPKKVNKSKATSLLEFKVKDRTYDQKSLSDGSKTERTSN